jgi:glycosyltransferase involved in cell wall biosynthesis
MTTIPVSVIIPAYNAERWLERAVTSVFSGEFSSPDEVLIVDDASTDETVNVANTLARDFSAVRVLRQPTNGGIVKARRSGLVAATNEWVAHLDADDYLSPGAVEIAFTTAIAKGADLCIWERKYEHNGQTQWWPDTSVLNYPLTGREAARLTLGRWRFHAWGVMKRDQWLAALDAVDVQTFDSDELVARQFLFGCQSVTSCDATYYWVENPVSTSKSDGKKVRTELLKSQAWLIDFASDNGYLYEDPSLAATLTARLIFLQCRIYLHGLATESRDPKAVWRRALKWSVGGAFRLHDHLRKSRGAHH